VSPGEVRGTATDSAPSAAVPLRLFEKDEQIERLEDLLAQIAAGLLERLQDRPWVFGLQDLGHNLRRFGVRTFVPHV
jgi:hypothetical protein